MKIGIGLPNTTPGANGRLLLDWARQAEERGFSSLATIDRIAYPSFESLVSLAAAGAVTERIGLFTNILLAPTRSPALLAKEAATVDQVSGGRLALGLGVGSRKDDYETSGQSFSDRGRRFDETLAVLHEAWGGKPVEGSPKPVGPKPVRDEGIPIVIGGMFPGCFDRINRWGIGWTAGGAPAEKVIPFAEQVREAWEGSGNAGEPYIAALVYFGLGEEHVEASKHSILDYYSFLGGYEQQFADNIPRTADAIRATKKAYEDAGVDELFWDPTVADLDQIERLADIVL